MKLIPKKTSYRAKFRIKLQTKKVLKRAFRIKAQLLKPRLHFNNDLKPKPRLTLNDSKPPRNDVRLALHSSKALVYGVGLSAGHWGRLSGVQATPQNNALRLKSNVCQKAWLVHDCELACRKLSSNHDHGFRLKSPSYDYGHNLLFGTYGLMSTHYGKLRSKCVSALVLECAKALKKKSKMHLRFCCDTPVTARPVETRMGKGKGSLSYWEAKTKAGTMLFEFGGLNPTKAYELLKLLRKKTHLDLKLVS